MRLPIVFTVLSFLATAILAAPYEVAPVQVTQWKSVFGKIETQDRIPARSRLGGTVAAVSVQEGDSVGQGQQIAFVEDEKLRLQLAALDATLRSLGSQLKVATDDLERAEVLLERGVIAAQRRDQLRSQVDVLNGRIGTVEAERDVLQQRETEGAVLAPISGTVLRVPLTEGAVVLPGEVVAEIGGGGFFLRLAVPERHARYLTEGAQILIGDEATSRQGTLAKVYPVVENGRVIADVEVSDLDTNFVDARVLVQLPIGTQDALLVPEAAVRHRMGLDFVSLLNADGASSERTVVLGEGHIVEGAEMREVLTGLKAGDRVAIDD